MEERIVPVLVQHIHPRRALTPYVSCPGLRTPHLLHHFAFQDSAPLPVPVPHLPLILFPGAQEHLGSSSPGRPARAQ